VLKREIKIFFKTENMFEPQLKFCVDKEKDEVACMATFVPTFDEKNPDGTDNVNIMPNIDWSF
jgi:hypothetical protein